MRNPQRKRFAFISILLFLALSTLVFADLEVTESTISREVLQGEVEQINLTITNTETQDLTLSFASSVQLEDNDGDQITLAFPSNVVVQAGATSTVEISADVDQRMDLDEYTTTLTVTGTPVNGTNNTFSDTVDLSITVIPGICSFGLAGSDLVLDIQEPDNNDDFSPGDTISVEVDVDNEGNADIDVQVEAFLFDEDKVIADGSSRQQNIEEGENEEFKFDIEIPIDNRDIDEDEDYKLFIKAFDDENEEFNCVQESISLDIKLENHDVVIRDSSRLLPEALVCGDSTTLNVNIINLGEEDEDVRIEVTSPGLGLNERSDTFELEDFETEEDNEASRQFQIPVAEGTAKGTYDIIAKVFYGSSSDSMKFPLEVLSCGSGVIGGGTVSTADLQLISPVQVFVGPRSSELVHVRVTNKEAAKRVFIISVTDVNEIAESASRTIALDGGESTNVFIPINTFDELEEGSYTAIVELSDGVSVLSSQAVTFSVSEERVRSGSEVEETEQEGGLLGLPAYQLIIGNLLVLFLIFTLIVIFKPWKKPQVL